MPALEELKVLCITKVVPATGSRVDDFRRLFIWLSDDTSLNKPEIRALIDELKQLVFVADADFVSTKLNFGFWVEFGHNLSEVQETDFKRMMELCKPKYKTACFFNPEIIRDGRHQVAMQVEIRPYRNCTLPSLPEGEGYRLEQKADGAYLLSVAGRLDEDDPHGIKTAERLARDVAARGGVYVAEVHDLKDADPDARLISVYDLRLP